MTMRSPALAGMPGVSHLARVAALSRRRRLHFDTVVCGTYAASCCASWGASVSRERSGVLLLVKNLLGKIGHPTGRIRRWQVVAFVLFLLAVGGVGSWLTVEQARGAREEVQDDLVSVGLLKVGQIGAWRTERLHDAASLAGNEPFAETALRWAESGDERDRQTLMRSLEAQAKLFDNCQAALLERDGTLLLGPAGFEADLSADALATLELACAGHRPVLTDLHVMADGSAPHVDAIAPLLVAGSGEATICVLLRASASEYLFPLLDSWPTESASAETLLIRREGDEVLFLNTPRLVASSALTMRVPLSDASVPAAAAVMGHEGVMEGTDYRGVDVLAALQAVPDSNWHVVAKIDASEALGPARTRAAIVGGLIGLLIVAAVVAAAVYWQHGLKERFAAAYHESLKRRSLLERYQYLVQEAQDAIILGDPDARIIEVNDRATELYGYSHDEFLSLRFDDVVPPENRDALREHLEQTKAGNHTTHELVAMHKDGSCIPIEVSDRVFSVDGQTMIQAIVRDISERKQTEEKRLALERQLQHSQRLESLGVLAGGIAHDFNNILTTILGHADLALHDMPLSTPGRRSVQEIVSASRKAADLCRQMLAYSGRGQFIIEEIDLRALIEDMLNLLKSSIPKTVLLNLNLGKNLPRMRGDVSQINQIVMNLVINAAEAIGERSGVITISAGAQECSVDYFGKSRAPEILPAGLYVTLEVSDTGAGMDQRTIDQIFEPFFTTKFTGRGLGLSAVLGIVRGHNAGIVVYSEQGKGSTIKVLFPAVESPARDQTRPPAEETDWRGAGTILLADDEETIRALGKLMLERLGFAVLVACDGREAVELFLEHHDEITAVLLDLTMPHLNGEEAYRAMREAQPAVRVVLCSGYSEAEIAARFAGKGTSGFLQKPYTLATLRRKLEKALE